MKLKSKRMTQRNHGTKRSYRIWMDTAGDNGFKQQNGELFMYGDIADRLGELEDLIEEIEKGGL